MKSYSATYEPTTLDGKPAWSYACYCAGRLIFYGVSAGKKRDAEDEVRRGIEARETLRAAAGLG